MERNYICLFRPGVGYQRLVSEIRDGVRLAARTVPVFRDGKKGRIQITIAPLSPLAEKWLGGGLNDFRADDIVERGFGYKIHPEGSRVGQCENLESGHDVNCYGRSVWAMVKLNEVDFIRIDVYTSGAKSVENEQCSLAGMLAAQRFFGNAAENASIGGERIDILNFSLIPDFVSMMET